MAVREVQVKQCYAIHPVYRTVSPMKETTNMRRITPVGLLVARTGLGISQFTMAQLLSVPLKTYLRWERGQSPAPYILARFIELIDYMKRDAPFVWHKFQFRLPKHKVGRPVGSKNVPEWMRPPRKPRRRSERPVGRPRRPGSQSPIRRRCLGYAVPGIGWQECDKTVLGGGRICDECRANALANRSSAKPS